MRIFDYWVSKSVKEKYSKLDKNSFIIGTGIWNNKCYLNAIQYALVNNCKVIECIFINEYNECILHYINKTEDTYLDNTLGFTYRNNDYYIIREVQESEYHNHYKLFTNSLNVETNKHLPGLKYFLAIIFRYRI